MDDLLEKIKDKNFLKKILTYFVLSVAVILLLSFLLNRYERARKATEISNFSDYYKQLLNQCIMQASPNCCISSVEHMAQANFKKAPEFGCPPGQKINIFLCQGSYKWCEPVR